MSLREQLRKTDNLRAMHAAIARLDSVLQTKIERGEEVAAPHNNHTVWRTQMHLTTVKTRQNISRTQKKR